jgi:hypothetical protein
MFNRTAHTIANIDPQLWAAITAENARQEAHIELIASENYASPAVMARRARSSPTSTPRAIPASATTAAASMWTWPRASRSSA